MRKTFSILFVFVMLAASMQVTIALHFCGGEIAGTRISVTAETASCGMEHGMSDLAQPGTSFTSDCCQDISSTFTVASDYAPAVFHADQFSLKSHQVIFTPDFNLVPWDHKAKILTACVSPPEKFSTGGVEQSGICVFRI